MKSLSKTYKDKLTIGEVKKSEKELYEKYGIKDVPTLMVITDPYEYKGEVYDTKEMKIDQLKKFLSKEEFSLLQSVLRSATTELDAVHNKIEADLNARIT